MYNEHVTIVDVIPATRDEEYRLAMPAGDLYVAAKSGCVIRRHDVSETHNPKHNFVELCGAEYDEATGTYTFKFVGGDVFTATSPDAYPTYPDALADFDGTGTLPAVTSSDEGKVATVNDSGVWVAQTPASGGGVLVVHDVEGTLDKTWQEIHDAVLSGGAVVSAYDGSDILPVVYVASGKAYDVYCMNGNFFRYTTDSASGYPVEPNNA